MTCALCPVTCALWPVTCALWPDLWPVTCVLYLPIWKAYSKSHFSYLSFPNMPTTRFSSRLCLIKGHRFLKKQYETFLSLLIPQKRWNILFSSENDRFFQLAHHRAKSSAMFELYWLPVSTLSELRRHVRLLNQWKSVKWSSVWWVQIHADFH